MIGAKISKLRTPDERISAKVIFWGLSIPHDCADQASSEGATGWAFRMIAR